MQRYSLLFDLDGTLTDSGPGIIHSVEYALSKLSYAVAPPDQLRIFVGPPLKTSFLAYGVREEEVERAIFLYRENYNATGKDENECYADIRELLEKLQTEGYPLYVATSKPEQVATGILQHFDLDRYFIKIAGATMDHSRENKDDVLRYLLAEYAEGTQPVMIGDTTFDVVGAQKIGIPCIGVSWGYGSVEDMLDNGAAAIAHCPEELYNLIREGIA